MNAWYILASVQHQLCILEYALQTNSLAGWSSDLSLTDDSENFDVGQHITCMDWCKLPVYLSGYSLLPQRQTTWLLCVACNP
jgi:hypothetical protein